MIETRLMRKHASAIMCPIWMQSQFSGMHSIARDSYTLGPHLIF